MNKLKSTGVGAYVRVNETTYRACLNMSGRIYLIVIWPHSPRYYKFLSYSGDGCQNTMTRLQNEITHSFPSSSAPPARNADVADRPGWPVAKRWVSLDCTILPSRDARSGASSIMKRSLSREPRPGLGSLHREASKEHLIVLCSIQTPGTVWRG